MKAILFAPTLYKANYAALVNFRNGPCCCTIELEPHEYSMFKYALLYLHFRTSTVLRAFQERAEYFSLLNVLLIGGSKLRDILNSLNEVLLGRMRIYA